MRLMFQESEQEQDWIKPLLKASFGGDRSAAGRYAAEQRWKGHVKSEPQGDEASMRLKAEFESEQEKVPNSPPNPKGLKAIALKNWVDGPFRRDHPRNVLINDMIRHIANGLVGLPLPRFRGIRFRQGDHYIPPETFVERTKNLLESIDQAEPKQPVLWRGLRGSWDGKTGAESQQQQQIMGLQVGDSFVSPIFSSSRDKEVAKMYASLHVKPDSQPSVVLKIEAGAKGLRTGVIPMDAEVLTGGKFVVTARTESTIPMKDYSDPKVPRSYDHKVIVISVKQVDTFGAEDYTNPSFRPDDSYRTETRL